MELMTLDGGKIESTSDPIAPLVNPEGPRPTATALSPLAAAHGGSSAASPAGRDALGLLGGGQGAKNIFFLAVVGLVVWKYGRRFF